MATNYKAGQYEDAFIAQNLQNWTLPKLYKEHPSAREGYTQFIANDRGHLLPTVPRSKASPWGTFMGTWEMPLKIPPAKLNLTSRSAAAASHLTDWIHKSTALTSACNGLRPQITGKCCWNGLSPTRNAETQAEEELQQTLSAWGPRCRVQLAVKSLPIVPALPFTFLSPSGFAVLLHGTDGLCAAPQQGSKHQGQGSNHHCASSSLNSLESLNHTRSPQRSFPVRTAEHLAEAPRAPGPQPKCPLKKRLITKDPPPPRSHYHASLAAWMFESKELPPKRSQVRASQDQRRLGTEEAYHLRSHCHANPAAWMFESKRSPHPKSQLPTDLLQGKLIPGEPSLPKSQLQVDLGQWRLKPKESAHLSSWFQVVLGQWRPVPGEPSHLRPWHQAALVQRLAKQLRPRRGCQGGQQRGTGACHPRWKGQQDPSPALKKDLSKHSTEGQSKFYARDTNANEIKDKHLAQHFKLSGPILSSVLVTFIPRLEVFPFPPSSCKSQLLILFVS
ncbi:protein Flattop isoform X1 [Malaclemys terrapin pileata]|uniref:protein Flattop isoform X1 n=1 Tax=Malaclemys terrapin pileata TaxID=2991368 RepID=UPI0023A898BC|nr:protein Flattop isoform X1 [Malaclemys terrapin pileata]